MRKMLTIIAVLSFLLGVGHVQAESDEAIERNKLGVELLEEERVEEAIAEFQKAVELNQENASARLNLAYTYDRQGRIEEAMAEYRKAIELEPGNLHAHNNLGVLYDKKGFYDEAIAEFEKALQIDPSDANVLENLENTKGNKAIVQEQEEQIAQAQRKAEAHPDSPTASYKLARLYAFYGKKDQAIEWLEKALKQGFNDFDYLKADPALKDLRNDPSFTRFLRAPSKTQGF